MPLHPHLLTAAETAALDARVAVVEAQVGVELVAMVAERASHYPQIPWKAFALGASLGGLAAVIGDLLRPDWVGLVSALVPVLVVLGAGAALAVATVVAPPVARCFLRRPRRDFETRRYAELMFRRRGVDATRARTGVLIVVCVFERRIEIVADRAFDERVAAQEWGAALAAVTARPGVARPAAVLLEAIAAVERLLLAKGFGASRDTTNELPDRPREERG
jgi:putative membrane protein